MTIDTNTMVSITEENQSFLRLQDILKNNASRYLVIAESETFRIRTDGTEYWSARELAPTLEYTKWKNFHKVIRRAMIACEKSGRSVEECFSEVRRYLTIWAVRN